MANCSEILKSFNNTITLSGAKKESLKRSRKDLRKKIKKYFREKKPDEIQPKFKGQGSFDTDVIINPIPRTIEVNGEDKTVYYYDIDDGIYFIGDDNPDDRKSVQTYHNWIVTAVDGHTSTPPKDKNACVRVIFADGHNIDLPVYYKQNDIPELAHKVKGWIDSDPKAFTEWFNKQADANPQLRRIVRYLKAWADYREYSRTDKAMPTGLVLTILAANHFYKHDRDDIALKETLVNIESELRKEFKCERPTVPEGEDLLSEYTCKDYFMEVLRKFIDNAKKAIEEKNQKKSCEYWQKSLGDRVPCSLAKDEDEDRSASAGLLAGALSSRPFGGKKNNW